MQTIGEKISALRKQRKMTQDELAEKMGVSSQAVSKWETNMSIPDLPSLINLADFFGITLDELVRDRKPDVRLVPEEQRRDINEMLLRVNVHTVQGDTVKVNLPLALLKIAADAKIQLPKFTGSEALQSLDLHMLLDLVEKGVVGEIVKVETSEGDIVEVTAGP